MAKLAPVFKIPRTRVVNRELEILKLCKGKKVLHIGCADVPYTVQRGEVLLHKQLANVAGELWGIDTSAEGCAILQEMGFENIICGNLSQQIPELKKEAFELILAGEVIEHCQNPGDFLVSISQILDADAELLLTTVNSPSLMEFLFAALHREKVHPDHNFYFSYHTLRHLFEGCGLNPFEIYYYNVKISVIDKLLSIFKRISQGFSDGIIIRARVRRP